MALIEEFFRFIFQIVSDASPRVSIEQRLLFTNRVVFLSTIRSFLGINGSALKDLAKILWKSDPDFLNSECFYKMQHEIMGKENLFEINRELIERWSEIYEKHISEYCGSDGKSKGVYYTSNDEIRFMIFRMLYNFFVKRFSGAVLSNFLYSPRKVDGLAQDDLILVNVLLNSKLIDISCGSGLFLTEYADILLDKLESMGLNDASNCERILTRIYGIDIILSAVELSRFRLILTILFSTKNSSLDQLNKWLEITNRSIIHADALSTSIISELRSQHKRFDFLIGNPPYIKPDSLTDKEHLKTEIFQLFKEISIEIPSTSDYYIYFFYFAFQYIKDTGIICLLTSNSWLDVKYGYPFQRFLLEWSEILEIIEHKQKKSFKSAYINTVITIARSKLSKKQPLDSFFKTKFIGLKNSYPFFLLNYKQSNWDSFSDSVRTEDYELKYISRDVLYALGSRNADYIGAKWGSMILRAPDILLRLIETKKAFYCRLNEIAEVKTGVYTGLNKFFYMTKEKAMEYGISEDFLVPILRDSDDIQSYEIQTPSNVFLLKIPPISKSELSMRCPGLVRYIEEGEKNTTKGGQKAKEGIMFSEVCSVKARKFWYSIPEASLQPASLFIQYITHINFYCPISRVPILSDRSFHRVYPKQEISLRALAAVLNSSLQTLFVLTSGRYNLGGGALKFETMDAKDLFIIDLRKLPVSTIKALEQAFEQMKNTKPIDLYYECGVNAQSIISKNAPHIVQEKKYLDDIIFDLIGIREENEKKEIYEVILRLIEMRLKKARVSRSS